MEHLWEVKHDYYCNEGNYYSSDCAFEYKSWHEFLEEMADADFDMNLLFRWDWSEEDDETGEPNFSGDINYRNGKLKLFYMQQRKGRYTYSQVDVCRADEQAVIDFLKPRMEHLINLWQPLSISPQLSQNVAET